jgi:4-amino-4-deoxy-L-arabinose transferase-like glycosyltransferase
MGQKTDIDKDSRNKGLIIPILILLIIVLSGFYVRIDGLANLGLGSDEPIHIYPAKSILETGEPLLPSGIKYSRALPFTYSVALSFKLFGINEISARLPSVIFGTLSIILIFFIGKEFFGTMVGLVSALLLAFIPFEIAWSRTCRMYSMYQFFFLFGFFAFYRGFESEKAGNSKSEPPKKSLLARIPIISQWNLDLGWLFLSGILLIIAFAIQPEVLIFGVSISMYLLSMTIITLITRGYKQTLRSKYFSFFLFSLACAIIALSIPGVFDLISELHKFNPAWSKYIKNNTPATYFNFLVSPIMFPIMAFFILGAVQACIRGNKPGFYTVVSLGVPLVIHSFFVRFRAPRYIYDIFPLILLISSYSICNVFSDEFKTLYITIQRNFKIGFQYESVRRLFPVFAVLLFFLCFFPISPGLRNGIMITKRYQTESYGGEYNADWKVACDYLRKHYQSGDVIVASIPLAADFYKCGHVEYMLNNGEIDQFRKLDGSRFMLDVFSNAKAIVNLDDLKEVLSTSPSLWIISDGQRFNGPGSTPDDVRDFITKNLTRHSTKADDSIFIFKWDGNYTKLKKD